MVAFHELKTVESQKLILKNTLYKLIEECKNLKQIKIIHTQILKSPTLNTCDQYNLISRLLFFCSFSNCGSFNYANNVFHMIKNPDLPIYNIMIRAYTGIEGGDHDDDAYYFKALMLYKKMLCKGIMPNNLTFPFLLKGCNRWLDCATGEVIHAQVIKFGFFNDVFVGNSLISLFMNCGLLSNAMNLFDEMFVRDIVTWNSMVIGYLRNGEFEMALDLFKKMNRRNIITWNSIITGLVQAGHAKESLEIFHEMQYLSDGVVKPDKITIASVLSACAHLGAIDHGKWVHAYLRKNGIECDVVIGTALVNMYGKCGNVDQAFEIFNEMPKKDASAWTAMISVFALHGLGWKAFDCFLEMERAGVKPNHVTFVGLLSACAHSGLVEQGRQCFDVMRRVYLIEPQVYHYACMVDILSRARLFHESLILIKNMPMKPDVYVWGALLGGCQMHGNVELGEKVAQHLMDLEPHNHAFYMNLCDIYAKAGRFVAAKRIRNLMKERRIQKKIPGCSMIEINGVVLEFSAGVSSELPLKEIVLVLDRLSNEMKT